MSATIATPDASDLKDRLSRLISLIRGAAENHIPDSGILPLTGFSLTGHLVADGEKTEFVLDKQGWDQTYFELYHGSFAKEKMLELKAIEKIARTLAHQKQVPILLGHYRYHSVATFLSEQLTPRPDTEVSDEDLPDEDQILAGFEEKRAFFAAAYTPTGYHEYTRLPDIHRGREVDFIFPSTGYLTNLELPLQEVEIDFGDGHGFRSVNHDEVVKVVYEDVGTKQLHLRARGESHRLHSLFEIEIGEAVSVPKSIYWELEERIIFNGMEVRCFGHAWVFLGRGHTSIETPVILADGFPGHSIDELWMALNEQNFATSLLDAQRDVILVSYKDGKAAVEQNAGVMVAAIKKTVASRMGTTKLIVGGASMGGQVARYALRYLETTNQLAGEIDTYFSLDSPHLGATVPLSVQYMLRVLAKKSPAAEKSLELVESIASQEMLLHFVDKDFVLKSPSDDRKQYIKNLGEFPKTLRRIGIANGSGTGLGNNTPPSIQTVSWKLTSAKVFLAAAKLFSAPGIAIKLNPQQVKEVYFGDDKQLYGENGLEKMDSCPGGTREFFKEVGDSLSLPIRIFGVTVQATAKVYYNDGCFIPTISALSLPLDPYNDSDLYRDLSINPVASDFTDLYWGSVNTPHIFITAEICQWVFKLLGIPQAVTVFSQKTPVAAVVRNLVQRDLFAVNDKGYVCTAWTWEDDGIWHGWVPIGTEKDSFPQLTPVTAIASNPQQIDLFAVDGHGNLRTTYRTQNDAVWSDWTILARDLDTTCPIAAVSPDPGLINLFYVGMDSKVYTLSRDKADGDWSGPAKLAVDINLPRANPIAASSRIPTKIDLCVVGRDSKVHNAWYDGSRWNGWSKTLGNQERFEVRTPLAIYSRQPDVISLYGVAKGRVWQAVYADEASKWAGWGGLPQDKAVAFDRTTPLAVASLTGDDENVFAVAENRNLYTINWSAIRNSWGTWQELSGEHVVPSSFTARTPITAISTMPQFINLFAVDLSGQVRMASYTPNVGWVGWTVVGPQVV